MRHNGNGGRSPNEIQAEIERTRSDLDETLSAIEHRLTPGQLVDQGIDYLRHSGVREYVVNLATSAKQDPLPLALVGVGLAWLMMSRREPGAGIVTRPGPPADDLADGAHDAADRMRNAAASVHDGAARTSQKISQTTRAIRERAHDVGTAAREGADRVRSGFDRLAHEQPLALGAIGVAIGAVLAGVAPRTRQEDGVMGEASDRLKDKASQAGEEQLDHAMAALRSEGSSGPGDGAAHEQSAGGPSPGAATASPAPPATH